MSRKHPKNRSFEAGSGLNALVKQIKAVRPLNLKVNCPDGRHLAVLLFPCGNPLIRQLQKPEIGITILCQNTLYILSFLYEKVKQNNHIQIDKIIL